MELPIPDKVKKFWDLWNLRCCILLSLSLQAFLVLFASSRQRRKNSFLVFLIWGTYLLADWIAAVAIGLTTKTHDSDKSCNNDHRVTNSGKSNYNQEISAFWASFLLLHLGGPDSITSFALEDNEFWVRHLFGLFLQALAAGYSLFLTLPDNKLLTPTVLVFLVGIVKYAERTRALYLASLDRFGATALPKPEPGPDYEETSTTYASRMLEVPIEAEMTTMSNAAAGSATGSSHDPNFDPKMVNSEPMDEMMVLRRAYTLFERFKGLIVGFFLTTTDRDSSRKMFLEITDHKRAFRLIEYELSLMFQVLHTKVVVGRNRTGYILRGLSFFSLLGASIYFLQVEKKGFGSLEIILTYALLIGALVLDAISMMKLVFSDWSLAVVPKEKSWRGYFAGTILKRSKWSRLVFQYNMINYCLDELRHERLYNFARRIHVSGILDKIKIMWYSSSKEVTEELKKFIFDNLIRKSKKAVTLRDAEQESQQRGDSALSQSPFATEIKLKWSVSEFQYTESLLLWHIATEICYLVERSKDDKEKDDKTKEENSGGDEEKDAKMKAKNSSCDEEKAEMKAQNSSGTDEVKVKMMAENSSGDEEKAKTKAEKSSGDEEKAKTKAEKSSGDEERAKMKAEKSSGDEKKAERKCKILSDYMFYLLIMQPNMLSTVLGNWYIVFQDTAAEAKRFFSKHSITDHRDALKKITSMKAKFRPAAVKGPKSKSVFFDACILAKQLQKLGDERWEIMDRMWEELMCYAAINCRPIIHAQQPSRGGELLTFTWLLMNHFGLGIQFSEEEELAGTKMVAVK